MFCVTVYVHRQVKSPGYPYQITEIRTNSVTCTTATGYATFHRTCGLTCHQKCRTARITLPHKPSRVAHSGLCTLCAVYRLEIGGYVCMVTRPWQAFIPPPPPPSFMAGRGHIPPPVQCNVSGRMHLGMRARTHTHRHTPTHTPTHAHTHRHTHTHTHTHTFLVANT